VEEAQVESKPTVPVAELARRCAEEMARYRCRQQYDPSPCYELFRYALVLQDEEAWAALYSQYSRLVRRWLGSVPGDPDALVNRVFERFWRALPSERFSDFRILDDILRYLKRCAQSVAIDARRQEERERVERAAFALMEKATIEEVSVERILDQITGDQLYEYAMGCLNNSQERLAFHASFEWNMSPRMIAERWPSIFASGQEVSKVKERILRRLRRDEGLLALLGINGRDGVKNKR